MIQTYIHRAKLSWCMIRIGISVLNHSHHFPSLAYIGAESSTIDKSVDSAENGGIHYTVLSLYHKHFDCLCT